ncbi:restriction endonuclease [Macrococcus capreoli]|uniref:restriction endonuclease n=1 Tax=Macrococcus capreoli TaxID=2982690 RepID=UPI003EE4A3CA
MYLMQRVSHNSEEAHKVLQHNYLPIGWGDLRKYDASLANKLVTDAKVKNKYDFGQYFKELAETTQFTWLTPRQGYILYNFFNLDIDSIVLVPKPYVFDIYKVIDKPEVYSADQLGLSNDSDIGFVVKVEPIHLNVSRSDYLDSSLSSKLKYRATNLVFTDEDMIKIDKLIKNIEHKTPTYDFSETKLAIVNNIQDYLLNKINEKQFELLIKNYMKFLGSPNPVIPAKNDKGNNESNADVDIKAPFPILGIVIYIQAKHHNGISDTTGIRQLLAYESEMDESLKTFVPVKWFITTGDLEEDAIDNLVKNEEIDTEGIDNIKLVTGNEFAKMLYESGFPLDSNAFM